MPTNKEVERLQTVYRTYRESQTIQTQWSQANPGNQTILQERDRVLERLLQAHNFLPLTQRRILDVGCGSGRVLAGLLQWGAVPDNLYGIDLLSDRIETARQQFPEICFRQANAEQLDFEEAAFDLALLFTVFSSILNEQMACNVAGEVKRVLKSGGAVIWYDFRYNNPRNPHVRGITKAAIRDLFPNFKSHLQTVTLLPPLARRLGRITSTAYPLLASLPLIRTHYLGLLVKS